MKKALLFLVIASSTLVISCKKNYTCECKNLPYGLPDKDIEFNKMTKNDAKSLCDDYLKTHYSNSTTTTCQIK